jgi:hypothetical protein
MSVMDARPSGVEIRGYAGDTLTFYVNSDESFSGWTWTGQVRTTHDDTVADAVFTIGVPTPVIIDGVTRYRTSVTLTSTDTRALANLAEESDVTPQYVKISGVKYTLSSVRTYSGVWDIQVTSGPTTKTIVQGTIFIDADVPRS